MSSSPSHCLQPPSLPTSISVPEDLSESGVQLHLQRASSKQHSPVLSPSASPSPSVSVRVPQVITTRYSTEDLRGGGPPHNERGSGENPLEKSKQILHVRVNGDEDRRVEEEEEEEEEVEEEEEDDLCQSVSAPHLVGEGGEKQKSSGSKQRGEDRLGTDKAEDVVSPVHRKTKREVVFGDSSRSVLETKTGGSSGSDHPPTATGHTRVKSHRRSQSMSVVELGINPDDSSEKIGGGRQVDGVLRKNRGSSMLKPNSRRSPLMEGSQSSSASASRSNSIKENRSRASSLLTDASSLHESGESTSEDDTMELSGISCASLEGPDTHDDEASTATPLVNEAEQERLLPPPTDSPDGGLGGVILRGKKSRSRTSQEYRHSADVLSMYKDELEVNLAPSARRLNSESVEKTGEDAPPSQDLNESANDPEKSRPIGDSVFEHDVALSDVEVKVQSDDNLSQDKLTLKLTLKLTPSPKEGKKKSKRSPRFSRKAYTMKEGVPSSPKKVLTRGLTKEDVTPVVGKMKSILNSRGSQEDESKSQSEKPSSGEIATSPGGESTSLDRVPRSPVTSVKSNGTTTTPSGHTPFKYNASPLSLKTAGSHASVPPRASPPLSPPSPSRHSTSTSPTTLHPSSDIQPGTITKSSSERTLTKSNPTPSLHAAKKSKGKSVSLDGSAASVKEILNVKNTIAEPLQEENTEDDELAEHDHKTETAGKKESSKAKMLRDNIFRRSKSRKKALTLLGSGPNVEKAINESYSKGSGGTGAVRAKSAKQRPKLDDVFFPTSPSKSHSTEQEGGEGGEGKGSPRRKMGREHRRDSDSSLINSPTKTSHDLPLTEVDEHKVPPPTPDHNTLSPGPMENTSDSDREEVAQQLVRSMSESYPELKIEEETNWQRTMDRRVLRKMNKHERDRQNIIHELIQTERHHLRALHVLKLVFKSQMEKYLSEESLSVMFPELDNLIEISRSFLDRLEERRGKEGANVIIDDISDILLEEFTAENRERIVNTFGEFCTYHLMATEMYKEQLKKKQFGRLVQHLYRVKECQRLYLTDYYTSVSQRLTKMVQFLARLVKKTDVLKLDHAERLRQCERELESLVTAVNQHVDNRKNRIELEQIQERLEIALPRTVAKHPVLKRMRDLNLTAQGRRLIKTGDALLIHGHGKQLCELSNARNTHSGHLYI